MVDRHVALACSASFFFNDPATTEIYTLSLHDALPISRNGRLRRQPVADGAEQPLRQLLRAVHGDLPCPVAQRRVAEARDQARPDRKSTRLNSSHANISYAVFCLKKKKHRTRPHLNTST